jgi:hypothetical protein
MADKKISELPLITTISGSIVYVPIVHDGITEKITVEDFSKFTNKYAAQTGSANTFTANQTINANLLVTGDSTISSNTTIGGNLVVNGKLTAQEVHTEITSASIIFESGSTIFGNSADDTHQFTGVVSINGVSIGAGVINQFTASQLANDTRMLYITGALNAFTASQIGKDSTLAEVTSSLRYFYQTTSSLHAFTASQIGNDNTLKIVTSSLNAFTASQIGKDFTLSIVTSSLNNYTSSILGQANTIAVFTSSINAFTGSQLGKDLTLSIVTSSIDAHILKQATQTGSQDLINYNISVVTSSIDAHILGISVYTASAIITNTSIDAHILKQATQTGSQDLVNYNISVVTSSINAHILKQSAQTGSQDLVNYQNSIITSSYRIELNSIEAYTSSLKSAIIVNGSNVQIVGSLDVARLNVQYVSSSVLVTSGSNVFGDQVSDKHEFTGSVNIKDTLFVNGQAIGLGELNAFTGSQIGKDLTLSIVTSSIDAHILKQATQTGSQDLVNYNISVVTSSIDAHILKQSAQTGSQDLVNLGISTVTGSLIGIANGLMALTASMKGQAIVSSSQQITNYYKFAQTASANTFYGDQTITGSLAIKDSETNFLIEGNGFSQTYLTSNGAIVLNPGYGGVEMVGSYRTFKATDITADGFVSGEIRATNNVVSSSQQVQNYFTFAKTGSANTFYGTQTITGSLNVGVGTSDNTAGDLLVDTANKTVSVGRQSSTSGDNTKFVVRNRLNSNVFNVDTGGSGDVNVTGSFGVSRGVTLATVTGNVTSGGDVIAPSFYKTLTTQAIPFTTWTTVFDMNSIAGIFLFSVQLDGQDAADWAASGIVMSTGANSGVTAQYIGTQNDGTYIQTRISGTTFQAYQNGTNPSVTMNIRILKIG